ncbi:hypothetical protein Daus18300_000081 [Diaporthe australafricana]|uniref:Peptidase A1 domain-containing protein n=1 Tax=Diaporthe australafricana TaxID=127596 RepID=A0ABR3Y6P6_9PEZI
MSGCLNAFVLVPSEMLKILLITGFIALVVAAKRPVPLQLGHFTSNAHDPILKPHPLVPFTPGSPSSLGRGNREVKDRFKKTENYSHLHRHSGNPFGGNPRSGVSRSYKRQYASQNVTDLGQGVWYGVNVTFGTQELTLVLDTSSSDTWVFSTNTTCIGTKLKDGKDNGWGDIMCSFGPRYQGNFSDRSFEHDHFSTEYFMNETINGTLGMVDLTVAGISVTNQTVGLAYNANWWLGSGPSSGVLGLAYPGLTNIFVESNATGNSSYHETYSPVFFTMIAQGLTEGFFSLALSRPGSSSESAGVIAFGGVAEDLKGINFSTTAQTDIIIANVDNKPSSASQYSYYTILADGWSFEGASDTRKLAYIIDSDTPYIILPTSLANDVANAFDPPARNNEVIGVYYVDCDATAPDIAFVMNGTSFWLNPEDLIIQESDGPHHMRGPCFIAFNDGGDAGPFILGSPFLKNVLAIFDVENAVIQFSAREFY